MLGYISFYPSSILPSPSSHKMHQEQHTYTHLPSFHIRVLVRPNTRTIVITHIVYLTLTLVTLFGVTYDTSTPTSRYRTLKNTIFIFPKWIYIILSYFKISIIVSQSRVSKTLLSWVFLTSLSLNTTFYDIWPKWSHNINKRPVLRPTLPLFFFLIFYQNIYHFPIFCPYDIWFFRFFLLQSATTYQFFEPCL